jgi:hypothetical protein
VVSVVGKVALVITQVVAHAVEDLASCAILAGNQGIRLLFVPRIHLNLAMGKPVEWIPGVEWILKREWLASTVAERVISHAIVQSLVKQQLARKLSNNTENVKTVKLR